MVVHRGGGRRLAVDLSSAHGAVLLKNVQGLGRGGGLVKVSSTVEGVAGVHRELPDQRGELRPEAAHWRGAAVHVRVAEEQLLAGSSTSWTTRT